MVTVAPSQPYIKMEDVQFTGIAAEAAEVSRVYDGGFSYSKVLV